MKLEICAFLYIFAFVWQFWRGGGQQYDNIEISEPNKFDDFFSNNYPQFFSFKTLKDISLVF